MRGFQLVGILLFFAIGVSMLSCNENEIILSHEAEFRILRSKKWVKVTFPLVAPYQISLNKEVSFGTLGTVFSRSKSEEKSSEIGAILDVSSMSSVDFNGLHKLARLPNGNELPSLVRGRRVFQWSSTPSNQQWSLFYQSNRDLIIGGEISGDEFKNLPSDFSGIQKFKSANGDTEAAILVFGPRKNYSGGLWFFANFGKNPFTSHEEDQNLEGVLKISLQSSGPLVLTKHERDLDLLTRIQNQF